MTADELRKLFPNASEQFVARNASDYRPTATAAVTRRIARADSHRYSGDAPIVERNPRNGTLGTRKAKVRDTRKFLVRVTSFRRRLLDEDNLCEKYHVDCARYSGLLPSDAAGKAKIETSQEKVGSNELERVEIVITQIA